MAKLWIRKKDGSFAEKTIEETLAMDEGLVIGRDEGADIIIDDPAISRFHARIAHNQEGWHIIDLGSSNRTFVNGDPIQESRLESGDNIGIGDCELQLIEEIPRATDEGSHTQVMRRLGSGPQSVEELRAAPVLATLHRVAPLFAGLHGNPARLEKGLQLLVEGLLADRGAVLLLDGEALLCRASHSRGSVQLRGFVLSQTIFHEVMQGRRAVLSEDTTEDSRFADRRSIVGEEIRSVLAAPIPIRDGIGGILYLDRLDGEQRPFKAEDLYGVSIAAGAIGAGLQTTEDLDGLHAEKETLVKTLIETHTIIGESAAIDKVRDFIRRAAPTDSTVLVRGETGTGKELVARAIHYQSGRRGAPFVAINCAAIPEALVESELFGHERGAFTGADKRKAGKFESADGGTVFLDEIGELPLESQGKLLRLLEERCFERVGGNASISVDLRVVAATQRDLSKEVSEGRFREDLFYRLNVLEVVVPPLRERPDDLSLLIDHFLDHFSKRVGGVRKRLSAKVSEMLLDHPWPGNVRQLRNVIESGVVLSLGEEIGIDDLSLNRQSKPDESPEKWQARSLQELEREHIERMLDHVGWNKKRAAELLGIERSTLYSRLRNHGIRPKERS